MSNITTQELAFVTQFTSELTLECQQFQSKLKPYVDVIPVTGNTFTHNNLGAINGYKQTTFLQKTERSFPEFQARGQKMETNNYAIAIDRTAGYKMLVNPEQGYAKSATAGLMRKWDELALAAAIGPVYLATGDGQIDGSSSLTATQDGVQTITSDGTNATYNKLLEIREAFDGCGVGEGGNYEIIWCVTEKQAKALRQEDELINKLYNPAMKPGEGIGSNLMRIPDLNITIVPFPSYSNLGGLNANILTPLIQLKSGTTDVRQTIAFAKDYSGSGLKMGVNFDIQTETGTLVDNSYGKELFLSMQMNALRTQGNKVKIIECKETA